MPQLIIRPAAEWEMREARDWYETREPGLGSEFAQSVERCLEIILRHPEIYPVVYRNFRQGVVQRFPYSVFYFVSSETITVLSVFHSSRNPKVWERRT